jgi:hypothetical protein
VTNREVILLTVCWRPDADRFALQRESIVRLGMAYHHVVVAPPEDHDVFARFAAHDRIELLSTADMLGPKMDARRRKAASRGYPRRLGHRLQGLTKLAFAATSSAEAVVCLDADAFFVRPLLPAHVFSESGRCLLYEWPSHDTAMPAWEACAAAFLGVPPHEGARWSYQDAPFVFEPGTVRRLVTRISRAHSADWMKAMLRARAFDYATYGVFARHIDRFATVTPRVPDIALSYWFRTDWHEWAHMARIVAEDERIAVVLVQSTLGISVNEYRAEVASLWPDGDSSGTSSTLT